MDPCGLYGRFYGLSMWADHFATVTGRYIFEPLRAVTPLILPVAATDKAL